MRPIAFFKLSAVALLATACTVGPDFKRPAALAESTYTDAEQTHRINANSAELENKQAIALGKELNGQWWTLFRCQPLNDLIQHALKHNPNLKAAQAALNAAQEVAVAKKASLLPALDATASGTEQKTSGAMFGNPSFGGSQFTLYNTSVKVSYTLDVFGAIRRQIESQTAQSEYQHFELEATFLTLAGNIATTAIQEAALRAQITALEDIISKQTEQLNVIKQQFEVGAVSQTAVLAQETTLAQTKTQLPPLQAQLAQTRHLLTVLVGEPPNKILPAQFNLADLHLPEQLPLSLPSKLAQQRPDIRAQEALLHVASANIGVATASIYPNFTINASMSSIATDVGDLFIPGSGIWSLGGNLAQPLFHGGEATHKKRAAVALYQQAAENYRATVLQALQSVADTLTALEFDASALTAQNKAADSANASLELTRVQWQAGANSYVALLTAENNYQQTRLSQIKAQAARYADTVALFQSLGGGWWQREDLVKTMTALQPKAEPRKWWQRITDFW
ncbi:MAG: efflux transporter outer membrane subunit [Methylococcaceae bacterium]